MDLIDRMPLKLEQWKDVPKWLEIGYAMWVLRSMLGGSSNYRTYAETYRDLEGHHHVIRWTHRKYAPVEEEALANIIEEYEKVPPAELIEHRVEQPEDHSRIRAHFLQNVDFVLKYLNPDGTCRVRNLRGDIHLTGNPHKIAKELDTLPAVVRQAQLQLLKAG